MSAREGAMRIVALLAALALAGTDPSPVGAMPPPEGWEADFGPELPALAGADDAVEAVVLSFPFPYAGQTYTDVYVGTNGAVALGGPGEADDYPSSDEFTATTAPMLAVFWTDMSLVAAGSVHFRDLGDRAIFTWQGIGSYANQTAAFTFQLQIFDDGRVLHLYNGIPPLTAANIDENTFVGLTEGNLLEMPPLVDYTAQDQIAVGNSVAEVFPIGAIFDLDGGSLLFTPAAGGGFLAAATVPESEVDRPAIWETQYGPILDGFDDPDDGSQRVTLTFPFPYGGKTHTDIYVGTNGAIALGGLGEADDYPSDNQFLATTAPMLAPFWSDMSAEYIGSVHCRDFGDRAVITWNRIGTYQNPTIPFTFQAQLHRDGKVIFAYNGIPRLSPINIDATVYVGLTQGNLTAMPPGAEVSYMNQAPLTSGITVAELFPVDSLFDLDLHTIVFRAIGGTGYEVSVLHPTTVTQETPAIWEVQYGPALDGFDDTDDGAEKVTLAFPFPYGGKTYTDVYVGTNGAVALGGLGEANDYPSGNEFLATTAPMLAPFWSDMSLEGRGSIHLRDLADRAVITWNAIGSYENPTVPFTFQMQLHADGKIVFAYNGIPPITSENISPGVHAGLTPGSLGTMPPGAEVDYTSEAPFASGITVLEVFPVDGIFDLDSQTIVFDPIGASGYEVSVLPPKPVGPEGVTIIGIARTPGGVQIRWESEAAAVYTVQSQTVLGGAWTDLGTVSGAGPQTAFNDNRPLAGRAFYRVLR